MLRIFHFRCSDTAKNTAVASPSVAVWIRVFVSALTLRNAHCVCASWRTVGYARWRQLHRRHGMRGCAVAKLGRPDARAVWALETLQKEWTGWAKADGRDRPALGRIARSPRPRALLDPRNWTIFCPQCGQRVANILWEPSTGTSHRLRTSVTR
jgi:hypothetical protein